MARKHAVEIKTDGERFLDLVTVGEVIALESGETSMSAMANVVSKFVWKDGKYLEPEEGLAIVVNLSIRQLKDAVTALMEEADQTAVNPQSGQALEQP